jgi:hypothetical protein
MYPATDLLVLFKPLAADLLVGYDLTDRYSHLIVSFVHVVTMNLNIEND